MSDADRRSTGGDEHDVVPGAESQPALRALQSYFVGFAIAVLLTAASFTLPGTGLIWKPAIPVALIVLAVAQIGIHLVFFLHITTAPDNTNNVLALGFGVLIVALILAGSLWIMANLDYNMMPMDHVLRMQR